MMKTVENHNHNCTLFLKRMILFYEVIIGHRNNVDLYEEPFIRRVFSLYSNLLKWFIFEHVQQYGL